jgi:hypothetical protein
MEMSISNCKECPLVYYENGIGYIGCKISEPITKQFENEGQMPEKTIHELCPIKDSGLILKVL